MDIIRKSSVSYVFFCYTNYPLITINITDIIICYLLPVVIVTTIIIITV